MSHPLNFFTARRWQRFSALVLALSLTVVTLGPLATPPAAAVGGGWSTSGSRILSPSGSEFIYTGMNWYGFETSNAVAHGLWGQDYKFLIDKIKAYGYNTLRLPFSNQMWETNPSNINVTACPDCKGKRSRDVLALMINYAGSIGLHVLLDNHRSEAGNSAEANGLWYATGYTEAAWINDWVDVQRWVHGTMHADDTIRVNYLASDGWPIVFGYDLRNEPHTPSSSYLAGATWGMGDGIDPAINPNPNAFAPTCVASSTCHDWRLAFQRAANTMLGDAAANGWDYPLFVIEGIGMYPANGGNPATGPYDGTWWGGDLQGVNGNSTNAGAPVVLNAGGNASALGPAVANKVVYSPHEYGPDLFKQTWFNSSTCYKSGCGASSLADVWKKYWAYINLTNGVNPTWPGHASYPWSNTGHTAYTSAPILLGEFGTPNRDTQLYSSTRGSQGQWFTDLVNYIQSSYNRTTANDPGYALTSLSWTYWAYNGNDNYGLLKSPGWDALANVKKNYTYLCAIQRAPFAIPPGTGTNQCGSTGALQAAF